MITAKDKNKCFVLLDIFIVKLNYWIIIKLVWYKILQLLSQKKSYDIFLKHVIIVNNQLSISKSIPILYQYISFTSDTTKKILGIW